jgi:DNA-binding CsgD family transcriptional regulator
LTLEEFIEATNKATTIDGLFDIYKKAMAELGFDRLIFSLMTDHISIQRRAGHGIMLNYPDDWMKYYMQKGFEVIDPVRRFMYTSPSYFTWDGIMQLPTMTKNQRVLMKEGDEAKLHDGIGIPLRGPRGAIAGVGAASSAGGVELMDKNLLARANLLSQQFYTMYLHLETQRLDEEPTFAYLTDREQEILKWLARGKTKSEIGEILKLSEHTVHGYVKSALVKLEANNTTLGVLKALQMGLIQL